MSAFQPYPSLQELCKSSLARWRPCRQSHGSFFSPQRDHSYAQKAPYTACRAQSLRV